MKQILRLIALTVITCGMFYLFIVREIWSMKISALFIGLFAFLGLVNNIALMVYEKKHNKN